MILMSGWDSFFPDILERNDQELDHTPGPSPSGSVLMDYYSRRSPLRSAVCCPYGLLLLRGRKPLGLPPPHEFTSGVLPRAAINQIGDGGLFKFVGFLESHKFLIFELPPIL